MEKVMTDRLFKSIFYKTYQFKLTGMTDMEIVGVLESIKDYYIHNSCLDFTDAYIKSQIRNAQNRKFKLVPIKEELNETK